MSLVFHRLIVGYPDPQPIPPDKAGSWKIIQVCEGDSVNSSWALADVQALGSTADKSSARRCLVGMSAKALIPLPFSEQYGQKECHRAFEFTYKHRSHEVHRVRCSVIRVYFLYGPQRIIIIIKIIAKRKDNLSSGEEKKIIALAKRVLDQLEQGLFLE